MNPRAEKVENAKEAIGRQKKPRNSLKGEAEGGGGSKTIGGW